MAELDHKTRLELLQKALKNGEAKDHDYRILAPKKNGIIHFFYKGEEITTFNPNTMIATDNGHCAKFFDHYDSSYPANVERNIRALEEHFGEPIGRDFLSIDFSESVSYGKSAKWTTGVKTRRSGNRRMKNGSWSKGDYIIYSVAIPSEIAKELKLTPDSRLNLKAVVVRSKERKRKKKDGKKKSTKSSSK